MMAAKSWVSLRIQAVLCALALPLVALAVDPRLEQGLNDDWSYVRTAEDLARTGHLVYNGWATAMIGWQAYLGAAFVDLFGFSFTIVRLSMLLVAMMTAFLMQRSFVRCGISERNATLGTLTLVLSPLFLPLSFCFMTDLPGVFVIILCMYCCLRVLQSPTERGRLLWLIFAILTNAVGGTARQIAWLGVLVMVPSVLWLLRRERVLLMTGIVGVLGSAAFIAWTLHWFNTQPYAVPETTHWNSLGENLRHLVPNLKQTLLEPLVLVLPILFCFVPVALRQRRPAKLAVAAALLVATGLSLLMAKVYGLDRAFAAPFGGNIITPHSLMDVVPIWGVRPIILPSLLRASLTILGVTSLVAMLATRWQAPRPARSAEDAGRRRQVGWLAIPFCLAYLALLLPRGLTQTLFDRYQLALLYFLMLAVLLFYQEFAGALPNWCLLPLALFAGFAIAATHDNFSLYRARQQAIAEARATGAAADEIAGGFEYNSWTEVERTGFVPQDYIQRPGRGKCAPLMGFLAPHLVRHYALSFNPGVCDGDAGLPPVSFSTWLPPFGGTVYIVRDHGTFDGY